MQHPATAEPPTIDTVVDPRTPIWNDLADDWARVQAVLAEKVVSTDEAA